MRLVNALLLSLSLSGPSLLGPVGCGSDEGTTPSTDASAEAAEATPAPAPRGSADVTFSFRVSRSSIDAPYERVVSASSDDGYAAFLASVREDFGRDPYGIAIDSVQLHLRDDSTGVTTFDQFLSTSFTYVALVTITADRSISNYAVAQLQASDFVGEGAGPIQIDLGLRDVDETWDAQAGLLRGDFLLSMDLTDRDDGPADYVAAIDLTIRFRALVDTASADAVGGDCSRIKDGRAPANAPAQIQNCDLRDVSLTGRNLNWANFSGADLSGADLSGATLYIADLSGANLAGAKLDQVCLRGANLRSANLEGADLSNDYNEWGCWGLLDVRWSGATCPDGVVVDDVTTTSCEGHLSPE